MKLYAVKENHLYLKAYKKGQRAVGRYTAVYVMRDYSADRLMRENPEKKYFNRVGIAVTKKVGGAVERCRAKRLVREAYRLIDKETPLTTGMIVIISIRPEIAGRKMQEVRRDLTIAFKRLGMLSPDLGDNK